MLLKGILHVAVVIGVLLVNNLDNVINSYLYLYKQSIKKVPGPVVQLVMSLTADPGVASSILPGPILL